MQKITMKITLEIPEEVYKRYRQYYEPYIVDSEEIRKAAETTRKFMADFEEEFANK
jgi:hypothetical protein